MASRPTRSRNNSSPSNIPKKPAREIRLRLNPYPIPKRETVSFAKPNMDVGIRLSSQIPGGPADIIEITNTGPFHVPAIHAGRTCMWINGIPIRTSTQAAALIRGIPVNGLLVFTFSDTTPEFCRVIKVPFSRRNPGLNFDSARSRTLVRVSKVFARGSFSNESIHKGDVVLAVNGVPVSKVEEADKLLRQQPEDGVSVYILDVGAVVLKIAQELARVLSMFGRVSLMRKYDGEYEVWIDSVAKCRLLIDPETFHLTDPNASEKLRVDHSGTRLIWKGSYGDVIRPFMTAFNDIIDQQFGALEDEACQRAWHVLSPGSAAVSADVPPLAVATLISPCTFE